MTRRYLKGPAPFRELSDLLASLLIIEVLNPGGRIWLLSPWISDVRLIDNSHREYEGLIASRTSNWTFSMVLIHCAERGSTVRVVTRERHESRPGTARFLKNLRAADVPLDCKFDENLHEKGLLTEHFYLQGSMNFTHHGLNINRESITLETDPACIAEQHLEFQAYWDSV